MRAPETPWSRFEVVWTCGADAAGRILQALGGSTAPILRDENAKGLSRTPQRDKQSPSPFFENQLITYEQAAWHLSVSVPYLRKLKARGKIPSVPMGRGVRFRVKSLNEWAEKREIK